MSKEEVNENTLIYEVEEEDDEEETITIDFDNEMIYSKEEHLYVKDTSSFEGPKFDTSKIDISKITTDAISYLGDNDRRIVAGTIDAKDLSTVGIAGPEEIKPSFQNELQDLLLNSITSKAVASLLSKHRSLDTELLTVVGKKQRHMGELGDILENEIDKLMENRRMELRRSFVGSQVRYERIPEWAKNYVKEYIQNFVHTIAVLTEDWE